MKKTNAWMLGLGAGLLALVSFGCGSSSGGSGGGGTTTSSGTTTTSTTTSSATTTTSATTTSSSSTGSASAEERACVTGGGTVFTRTDCTCGSDWGNICGVGWCACPPGEGSHSAKNCDCPAGSCWTGTVCASTTSAR